MTLENIFYALAIVFMTFLIIGGVLLYVFLKKAYLAVTQLQADLTRNIHQAQSQLKDKKNLFVGFMPMMSVFLPFVMRFLKKKF